MSHILGNSLMVGGWIWDLSQHCLGAYVVNTTKIMPARALVNSLTPEGLVSTHLRLEMI